MDDIRAGRILRALRIRRGWTQRELGMKAGLSQAAISFIERGHSSRLSSATMRRVFAALDARWEPTVSWRGGELDRLIDEQHATLVAEVVRRLRALGWDVRVEATYSVFGERGSVDVIAARLAEQALLIVEVKSDLTGVESTVRKVDEKERIGREVLGPERFRFVPRIVGRLLVLPALTSTRSRVLRMSDVLDLSFPARGSQVRQWLRHPVAHLGGILFVPDINGGVATRRNPVRKRVRRARSSVERVAARPADDGLRT
jgi:transcriptional regulator with XRE-family HTH domain